MTDTTEIKPHKVKAVDINTESIKLYITIAVGSIAGLIAFHNSTTIDHNEPAFRITLGAFILSAIASVVTLNSYVILVNENKIEVTSRLPVWLNRFAVLFFILGLISAGIYFGLSKQKAKQEVILKDVDGIIIHDNKVEIGNNVKTQIRITKDSTGTIREISIPN